MTGVIIGTLVGVLPGLGPMGAVAIMLPLSVHYGPLAGLILLAGFTAALSLKNLFLCFIGCLWGTAVRILPGLGPMAGMALLLLLTFKMDPASSIIMLAGIFYGAM